MQCIHIHKCLNWPVLSGSIDFVVAFNGTMFFSPLWVTNRSTVLLAFTVKARSLCLWSYFSYVWQVDTALSHEVICLLQDCHKGHAILFFLHFSVQTQMYWRHIDLKHLMQYLKLYINISLWDGFMVNVLRRVWMVSFPHRTQVQVQVCFFLSQTKLSSGSCSGLSCHWLWLE